MVASKLYSSQLHSELASQETEGIVVRKSEVGVSRQQVNKLRRDDVKNIQKKSLDKRTELIIQQTKPKTDFKAKIEAILEEKLNLDPEDRTNQH